MIIASIDIGTNTVLLLIAKTDKAGKIEVLHNEFKIPRIGKGLKPGSPISDEKIKDLINVLTDYKKIIDDYRCDKSILTATNAFRIASNSLEIKTKIKDKLGFDVNIVSGNEEAKLSFLGASSDYLEKGSTLIIDIGGGSTELIYGDNKRIKFDKSFNIGAVSGTEQFLLSDPPSRSEITHFENHIKNELKEIEQKGIAPVSSIAIAGTPTTLACIKQNLQYFDENLIEGSKLSYEEIEELSNVISKLTIDEISEKYKTVVAGREDVLLAGTFILLKIMELLDLQKVIVSTKGIRFGAITNFLQNLP